MGPVEAKGIRGSDQRCYVLDMTRLTPRDANFVPKEKGGTGNWEAVMEEKQKNGKGRSKAAKYIPNSLEDDEWTMAVLRPELITNLTHSKMAQYLKDKKKQETVTSSLTSVQEDDSSAKAETTATPETPPDPTQNLTPDPTPTPSTAAAPVPKL